ncbi:MAG: HAD family hydrolase [Candidatus Omnitrophica bacterium]|nr:HAD family hydrolase [Candidatus Omnitrophota bacterium]
MEEWQFKIGSHVWDDVDLVVFDKDGTIIDFYYYWSQMVELRAKQISDLSGWNSKELIAGLVDVMGIDTTHQTFKPEGPVGLFPRTVVCQTAFAFANQQDPRVSLDLCQKAFERADEISAKNLNGLIRPVEGVLDLIRKLHEKKFSLAVATTDRTDRAELALDILGIRNLFRVVAGFDKAEKLKPHPDLLFFVNEQTGCLPEQSLMIGDTDMDVEMARRADYAGAVRIKGHGVITEKWERMAVIENINEIHVLARTDQKLGKG